MVLLIKCRRTNSNYKKVILKSYIKQPIEGSNNHEFCYPNPTYQDVHNNIDGSSSPSFQDVEQGDNIDVSPNPIFEDVQDEEKIKDNEFSVQLKN